ncbi:phosphoribosylformylglycinamidine synthase, partial [Candidatus Microgenomates bacterium]|nr:phosphoribosylformylglycinamidine synthase [Candidatus Microgenomates bacterium]
MITRIEVYNKTYDARAQIRKKRLIGRGYKKINEVRLTDVYTIDKKLAGPQIKDISARLINPVTQSIIRSQQKFDWAIETGYLPGVTDNVAHTAKELIEDLLKIKFIEEENVYTSQITFIKGTLDQKKIKLIAESLVNPLIQRIQIKSFRQYVKDKGMDVVIPKVKLSPKIEVRKVNLNVPDEELTKIGKSGIANSDGTRRGPLALDLQFMKAIQKYFQKLGRNPTDIEMESLAQTWSEHCKHTIFANPLDDVNEGLFNRYIK